MEIIQRQTYSEINDLLGAKEVDVAFICSGPYVDGRKKFGLKILAVPVVHGEKVYRSYILVNIDSPIKSFNELRGGKFAFVDPNSNTGYLVPKYMLAKLNETPKSYFKETFFTYSHDKSIEAVSNNFADGCAIDGLIWEFMKSKGRRPSVFDIIVKPVVMFTRLYFLKQGFRDGVEGFLFSALSGFYVLLKNVKLWELSRITENR